MVKEIKKTKENDLRFANGVKQGFDTGIKKSLEVICKSMENIDKEKYSNYQAALNVFSTELILELSKFLPRKE